MSYSIDLRNPADSSICLEVGNYTSNVCGMWGKALNGRGLDEYDKKTGAEAAPDLLAAVVRMLQDPQPYRAMEPDNGWGDYEGATEFLLSIWKVCIRQPTWILDMCY